jgi:hypothetical protein
MPYRFVDSFRAGSGWNFHPNQELFTVHSAMVYIIQVCRQVSSMILFESGLQTCETYTIAECTVKNSWWWTEELSETCRVSFQHKFEKLVHLVGFIIRKRVTYIQKSLFCQSEWTNNKEFCTAVACARGTDRTNKRIKPESPTGTKSCPAMSKS